MKKIILLTGLLLSILQINVLKAQDDVYDKPREKQVKAKKTYSEPTPVTEEKTVPYNEGGNSTSRQSQSYNQGYDNNQGYTDNYNNQDNYQYGGSFGDNYGYGYSDRIVRFHNPDIRFSYGYSSCNGFFDPWYNDYSSYSAFTPSWTYGYDNFYNPFWGSQVIVINQPWISSWYSTGYNYSPWYNWYTPSCNNIIYNNGYSNYNNYYDYNKKNVMYTPRTGGYYNNTNNVTKGNSTYNYNYPNNTNNNGSGFNGNTQGNSSGKKWSTSNYNQGSNSNNTNVYKYNQPSNNSGVNNNNNTNNKQENTPSNNGGWGNSNNSNSNSNNSGTGGVTIGKRPK